MTKKRRPTIRTSKSPKRVKTLMNLYVGTADVKKRTARFIGKFTRLGQQQFIYQLLVENEKAPNDKKLTDFALEEIMKREFPHNPAMLKGFKTRNKTVNYYRHQYNQGTYSRPKGEPPTRISYRYNDTGIAVDCRTGKMPMSALDRANYARRYFGTYSALRAKETDHVPPPDPAGAD